MTNNLFRMGVAYKHKIYSQSLGLVCELHLCFSHDGGLGATRVSQKVMSPVNFNRFNLHIFSRNFKGV